MSARIQSNLIALPIEFSRTFRVIGNEFWKPLARTLLCVAVITLCGCPTPQDRPPNVVLVLVDQLRKDTADDWLSATGSLASKGIVFDQMRSAAPWTYPSVLSMMTGLYPQQHGADGHMHRKILSYFDSGVPTLQKILHAAGYRTAGFVTNPFLHTWNAFHEGFDHYDAIASDQPEFTYIHYIDVHGPYWNSPFEPNLQAAVEFTDARIIEAYEYFLGRYQGDLVFVVTSDHGLGLGDDKIIGDGPAVRKDKGSLHDFNLRIPFMILPSDRVVHSANIDAPCSNIDITPTIADWAGVQLTTPVPGVSLLPAIAGDSSSLAERPLYARVSSFKRLSDGMFLDGKKYIRHFDYKTREVISRYVFDVGSDPREVSSITNDFGEFEEILDSVAGTRGTAWPAHFGDIPADTQRQLKALGYLSND